jgi:hypothetical protein
MKNVITKTNLAAVALAVLVLVNPAQAAAALTAEQSGAIADAIALILLVIAAGGLGMLTISGAKVGWVVAAKFISRMSGKA